MLILGVESSCDETGIALYDSAAGLLSHALHSQVAMHAEYGGVVPEVASRAHLEAMVPTMRRALDKAGIERPDAVAATIGPGLAGALLVGAAAAKAYAAAWGVPFYAVNHLGGHLAADVYEFGPLPECVALLVSGGHTHLLHVRSLGEPIVELGSTVDDAAGEAYDKVARLLGLAYPGGPVIDREAQNGDPKAIAFPRGLTARHDLERHRFDYSFSGLKTAVARYVEQRERDGEPISIPDVAASFQEAVADVLTRKAVDAALEHDVKHLVLGGGVAANSRLRTLMAERTEAAGIELRVPRPKLCTDNGAMVAALGAQMMLKGREASRLDLPADSSMPVTVVQA